MADKLSILNIGGHPKDVVLYAAALWRSMRREGTR